MRLNTIKPAEGAKHARKRVGRGIGSGTGKTCGRGHKGQKSRTGGKVQIGFDGFRSAMAKNMAEIRLHELNLVEGEVVDMAALRTAGLINAGHLRAKVVLSGELSKAVTLQGIGATKGAQAAIEAAGGKVEA